MAAEIVQPGDQVFENPAPRGNPEILCFLGAAGLIVFAMVGFLLAIRLPNGQMTLHLTTTLPTILAVGLLARGVSLRQIPRRIIIGSHTLQVVTNRATKRYTWSEIGTATEANVLNSSRTCLRITDTAGKTIIRVDEAFPNYAHLVRSVKSRIDAKPDDTATRLLVRKAKRTALLTGGLGCFMAFAAGFVAYETHERQRGAELLAQKRVPGKGEIVRRFVAPNGVTKRIEYRVAGSGLRNVEVDPGTWDRLAGAQTVDVEYVPDEPDISRLERGEVKDDDPLHPSRQSYLTAVVGALMAIFFIGVSPIAWLGYDLTHDKELQTWKIKRHGRVIWASKPEPVELA